MNRNKTEQALTEAQIMNTRLLHTDMNFLYKPYERERSLYTLVATGDIDGLRARKPSLQKKGLGILSQNELRNILYHMIVNTASCARTCIEHGMDMTIAYTISDLYIQKADLATSIEELEELNYEMIFNYTSRMRELQEQKHSYPPEIYKAVEYIEANLHKPLHASEVAEYLHISTSTFSNKFLSSTGSKFNAFVEKKRLMLAKRYLRFTDLSISEIASNLSFCSQSYFNTRFKENVGITPLQYRNITENELS